MRAGKMANYSPIDQLKKIAKLKFKGSLCQAGAVVELVY